MNASSYIHKAFFCLLKNDGRFFIDISRFISENPGMKDTERQALPFYKHHLYCGLTCNEDFSEIRLPLSPDAHLIPLVHPFSV